MIDYCDAHNHLQDARFAGRQEILIAEARQAGVSRWVVNGTGERDWPAVARLAAQQPGVVPSFGYHPWYLPQRTADWQAHLEHQLNSVPGSVVGEIGLDRWILELDADHWARVGPALATVPPASLEEQIVAFEWQWRLAATRHLPVSVHCLKAWGLLQEKLHAWPRLERGFLLHSYGGPAEMIPDFVRLGAYFGFPGYFLHARKMSQRETFRRVPVDRLLVETDAPDQLPPESLITHPLISATSHALNHPANLPAIYAALARHLDRPLVELRRQNAENFARLFGNVSPGDSLSQGIHSE